MILAETPTLDLDGGTVLLILLVLLAVFGALAAVVFGGAVLALQAGRGSRRARPWWLMLTVVELFALLAMLPEALEGRLRPLFAAVAAVLGAHAMLYLLAMFTSSGRDDGPR